ncbi:MAG TPA: hypothetical protein DDY21_04275 [Candidatus Moranbacteria bacterium]|nr:hypothetical protein [Candidatus Moranbacteria bacterium]HCO99739.1 hypothetical protein [Candidatus Moranbacteria bacterium]
MEKTANELVRELRVRLVREVAMPNRQSTFLSQKRDAIKSVIESFDSENKKFREYLSAELMNNLEKTTLRSFIVIAEKEYADYIIKSAEKHFKSEKEVEELTAKIRQLKRDAADALIRIKNDVLAKKYGCGEPELSSTGLVRIVGFIDDFNEIANRPGISIDDNGRCSTDAEQVSYLCENQHNQPPLFYIDIKAMPLKEEEAKALCRGNDDFQLLVKYIPSKYIPWDLNSIYCLYRTSFAEIYAVCVHPQECVIVNVEIECYPRRIFRQLGKLNVDIPSFIDVSYWMNIASGDCIKTFGSVSESEQAMALSMMAHHICDKHPGLIIEMPQLEK